MPAFADTHTHKLLKFENYSKCYSCNDGEETYTDSFTMGWQYKFNLTVWCVIIYKQEYVHVYAAATLMGQPYMQSLSFKTKGHTFLNLYMAL